MEWNVEYPGIRCPQGSGRVPLGIRKDVLRMIRNSWVQVSSGLERIFLWSGGVSSGVP